MTPIRSKQNLRANCGKVLFSALVCFALGRNYARASGTCEDVFSSERLKAEAASEDSILAVSRHIPLRQRVMKIDLFSQLLAREFDSPEELRLKQRLEQNREFKIRAAEYKLSRVSVEGVRYSAHYTRFTPVGRTPHRTRVLLHHGFSRSSLYFHDMVLMLTALGFEVIVPDGINVGRTLELSSRDFPENHGVVEDPSPLNDALTVRNIILAEHLDEVVLLGHSRGHAVTSQVAAMSDMGQRIVAHFPTNPYTRWMVDIQYDNYNYSIPGGIIGNAISHSTRGAYNALAVEKMAADIASGKFLEERAPHEILPTLNIEHERKGVLAIGKGLLGKNIGAPGFSALELYGLKTRGEADNQERNDFGLARAGISQISTRVLSRTFVLYGGFDKVVLPDHLTELLAVPGVKSERVRRGTHYLPSERPARVVQYMLDSLASLGAADR